MPLKNAGFHLADGFQQIVEITRRERSTTVPDRDEGGGCTKYSCVEQRQRQHDRVVHCLSADFVHSCSCRLGDMVAVKSDDPLRRGSFRRSRESLQSTWFGRSPRSATLGASVVS